MKLEAKEKLSKSLKAKWASGTRKPNPLETYKKSSISLKRGYAEGRFVKPTLTTEQARKLISMYDREKMLKVNREIGNMKIGVPNPPGPSAKGPKHWKSLYWILTAPNKQIIQGWNLNELIRQNANLFLPEDLNWYGKGKSRCRASKGLRQLFEMKKNGSGPKVLSWKGWMIGDRSNDEIQCVEKIKFCKTGVRILCTIDASNKRKGRQ